MPRRAALVDQSTIPNLGRWFEVCGPEIRCRRPQRARRGERYAVRRVPICCDGGAAHHHSARRRNRSTLACSANYGAAPVRRASIKLMNVEKSILWKQITTEFRGRAVDGSYAVEGGTVKVRTPRGEKTTQLVGLGAIWIAGRLWRELAAEGKA
jgi:hypothetical protein